VIVGKYGKLAPKFNPKTLKLKKYLMRPNMPPPPAKLWREFKIPADAWQMFGNDTIGDCTCAAVAHMLMLVTAHTGTIVIPTLADVVGMYSAVTGYDPTQTQPDGSNPTDNGAAITDILNYWQTTGLAGHKILGWGQIDNTNINLNKLGMYIFAATDIGVQVPASAETQFAAGQAWTPVTPDGGIQGGHSVPNFGEGAQGESCVTWSKRQEMTWDWFTKYGDESYVVVTQDWVNNATGLAPNMLNMDALVADLAAIKA